MARPKIYNCPASQHWDKTVDATINRQALLEACTLEAPAGVSTLECWSPRCDGLTSFAVKQGETPVCPVCHSTRDAFQLGNHERRDDDPLEFVEYTPETNGEYHPSIEEQLDAIDGPTAEELDAIDAEPDDEPAPELSKQERRRISQHDVTCAFGEELDPTLHQVRARLCKRLNWKLTDIRELLGFPMTEEYLHKLQTA